MLIKKLSKHCFRSVSMVLSPAKGHCRKETMYTCKHSASPLIIKRYRDMKHLYHADRFPEQGIIKPVFMYHLQEGLFAMQNRKTDCAQHSVVM